VTPALFLAVLLNFGPETQLTAPQPAGRGGFQSAYRIAGDGSGFLAIWSDTRGGTFRVYASRLDRELNVLDPTGIQVAFGAPLGVVWTGEHYLVAYTDFGYRLEVVSIDREGRLGTPREVHRGSDRIGFVDLATNGETVLIALSGRLVLTDSSGNVMRTASIDPSNGDHASGVASDGDGYVVAVRGLSAVSIYRVTASGEPALLNRISIVRGSGGISIAFAGGRYVVVWTLDPDFSVLGTGATVESGLRSVTLTTGGAVSAPRDLQRVASSTGMPPSFLFPRLVPRGDAFLLTYFASPESRIFAQPLATDGTPAGAAVPLNVTGRDLLVEVADSVALWVPLGGRLNVAHFDPFGIEPFRNTREVARMAPTQSSVQLVDASGLLVSWSEEGVRMMARRGGTPVQLRPGEVVLAAGDVIWTAIADPKKGLLLYRWSLALEPIDAEPIVVTESLPNATNVSAAAANGDLLIAWSSHPNVRAARVQGRAVTPVLDIGEENRIHYSPAVAWDGEGFVVAWLRTTPFLSGPEFLPPPPSDVLALRVSRDTEPLVVSERTAYATGLRAMRTASGIALAWTEKHGVFGTIFSGAARPLVAQWSETPKFDFFDFDLAPRPGGGVLLLWSARNAPLEPFIGLRQIDANGLPDGESTIVAKLSSAVAIATVGAQVTVGYERRIDDPSVGGVQRIVLRSTQPPRNRAVR
jgi:hypothetical protein